jgi:hypothetical protein
VGEADRTAPTAEAPRRASADNEIIDKRAVAVGLVVVALAAGLSVVWRVASRAGSSKPPNEFAFSVMEHAVEEFKLREPMREILQERLDEPEELVEEKPDVHIATDPVEFQPQEVIQSKNIDVDVQKIDLAATEMVIEDAPQEIAFVTENVIRSLNPIAVATDNPAYIFRYKEPSPPDRPQTHLVNAAPRPGRTLTVVPKAFGEQDVPSMGQLGPANINLFGTGEFLSKLTRSGDLKSRTAVDAALHWLALHQEPEGHWDASKYEGQAGSNLAVTGLAALAFMGGGHTVRKGEYSRNVLRAVETLMRNQKPDGSLVIGKSGQHLMYTHAICTIALCESYGRARDERVGLAAQKAISFCEKGVSADGGWRYRPKSDDTDMSVTAWFLQALKTAKLAQIKFDHSIFSQGLSYLDSVTDQGASKDSTGAVGYQFVQGQDYGKGHPALTAAGMMVRQFNGMSVKHHVLVKGAELTRALPPDWRRKDFYCWYYATYAMHNMGGEYRIWWNRRIRDVLVENQCRQGDNAGSWDPKGDQWGQQPGRVYTTALGALCLEVYYRYSEALNSFGVAPDLDELFFER